MYFTGAADRVTTRPEDMAYSLMGIFGVNMPILYGEGKEHALFRLQVMIFQMFPDRTLFAWKATSQHKLWSVLCFLCNFLPPG